MADTYTNVLKLTKAELRTPGWGAKTHANLDSLDSFLTTILASGIDPNDIGGGDKLGGYKNQIVLDFDNIVWICTVTDLVDPYSNVEWEKLGQLTVQELSSLRTVWTAGQAGTWRNVVPSGSPVGVDILDTDDFVDFVMSSNVELRFDVGASFGTPDAQVIYFHVTQDVVVAYTLSSVASIKWPGGVDPPAPPIGAVGLYAITREPGAGNTWLGAFNLGY